MPNISSLCFIVDRNILQAATAYSLIYLQLHTCQVYFCPWTFILWYALTFSLPVSINWKVCKSSTVYPKKYAHGFCFAVLCCGYTLTDFPISIRLTSLALWQSNDCPSASKATLMNMYKYFRWIHYERLHNHNKAKHNKTVCTFLGIYCMLCISPGFYFTIGKHPRWKETEGTVGANSGRLLHRCIRATSGGRSC